MPPPCHDSASNGANRAQFLVGARSLPARRWRTLHPPRPGRKRRLEPGLTHPLHQLGRGYSMRRRGAAPLFFSRRRPWKQNGGERYRSVRAKVRRNAGRDSEVLEALVHLGWIVEHHDENGPYWVATEKGEEAAEWLFLGSR